MTCQKKDGSEDILFWFIRKVSYSMLGAKFGNGSQIDMECTVMGLCNLKLGEHCHINRSCIIDARGG